MFDKPRTWFVISHIAFAVALPSRDNSQATPYAEDEDGWDYDMYQDIVASAPGIVSNTSLPVVKIEHHHKEMEVGVALGVIGMLIPLMSHCELH